MTDDIATMTVQLAQDPTSLVFLPLAEALRGRGQLDAALTVALRGLSRYPEVADAYDLVARIQCDRGDGDAAFDAWTNVLRLAPDHLGAHKGLAFLFYRGGEVTRSLRHLTRALEIAPGDASLTAAVDRIRIQAEAGLERPSVPDQAAPQAVRRGGDQATLLFDQQGRVLRGDVVRPDGSDASEAVAAGLAGVSREAERTARMLGLGEWRAIAVEGGPVNYEIRSPSEETLLLLMRGREVPAGRLSRIADRAVADSVRWLEELE